MRARFTANPGDSLRAISTPAGHTRGIQVDNPSGSWLTIPSLDTSIPPYTLGWGMTLPYGATSIDVIAGNGPAGEIGTNAGDPYIVWLSTEPVATSKGVPQPGAPFIAGFTPNVVTSAEIRSTDVIGIWVPGIPGRRFRVLTFGAAYAYSSTPQTLIAVNISLRSPALTTRWAIALNSYTPSQSHSFALDLAVGDDIVIEVQAIPYPMFNFGGARIDSGDISISTIHQVI